MIPDPRQDLPKSPKERYRAAASYLNLAAQIIGTFGESDPLQKVFASEAKSVFEELSKLFQKAGEEEGGEAENSHFFATKS